MATKVDSTHPDYDKQHQAWAKCRCIAEGSEAVKAAGITYLPSLSDQRTEDYQAYKNRALFFEGTTRTISGLTGMLFAKEPTLTQPEGSDFFKRITPGFVPIKTFLKNLSREVLTVGRAGIMVDVDNGGIPYITVYKAEDIINWRVESLNGKRVITFIVVREEQESFDKFERTVNDAYRVLYLENGVYAQDLYIKNAANAIDEFTLQEGYPLFPAKAGKSILEIPFFFVNANGANPAPERPPLSGLVNANIAHYMNSADLEHGRHFTGLPTPWAAGFPLDGESKLSIGSQTAWVSSKSDAKAGYLEFTGQGLGSLENGMKEKVDLMIILGARLLEAPKKASESAPNQAGKKQGENSILANIADSISDSTTKAIQFAADWGSEREGDYLVEIHKDFTSMQADPQLLTVMIGAIQGGLMSYETWFYNLKKAGMIQDGITAADERDRIEAQESASFANPVVPGAQQPERLNGQQ